MKRHDLAKKLKGKAKEIHNRTLGPKERFIASFSGYHKHAPAFLKSKEKALKTSSKRRKRTSKEYSMRRSILDKEQEEMEDMEEGREER